MAADRLISLPYLFLRSATAGFALLSALVQTFVFARILTPDVFAIFILIGAFGVSLWLIDLGMARILFVRLREQHLKGRIRSGTAEQANSVVVFYLLIVLAMTTLCFAVTLLRPAFSTLDAMNFALFLLFTALNLVWFALRNVCFATDQFIRFETLETIRRAGHMAALLVLLAGIPLWLSLVAANLLWGLLLWMCVTNLVHDGALGGSLAGFPRALRGFFREHRPEILRSGVYAVCDTFIYNFPYLLVPVAYGVGAPTIIFDTAFKIFRGSALIYNAASDIAVPRQTRAFAAHDQRTLIRATLLGCALSALPAAVICGLLIFAADKFFAILLGPAAVMPPAVTPILIVLLLANLVQTAANSLLMHTGFFHAIARLAALMAVLMIALSAIAFFAHIDIVRYLALYAGLYACGAFSYLLLAITGPIHAAGAKLRPART